MKTMINNFFDTVLQRSETRIAPANRSSKYLLDKNEQTEDIDETTKQAILASLLKANWNRYPASDYKDIEAKISEYCGLNPENIVLSAGSASIITTLLDFFALNNKNIVITQPSYSLFDYHCKTYNIKYKSWILNSDLEYDISNMPELYSESVLIITSPNNPVGNSIKRDNLEYLLKTYSQSFIIVDAVYCEFADEDFTQLVKKYENLIVLRSFSKAFPIAGLRLGYLCAAPETAAIIKKLVLQFSITHFSLIFAREMLFNKEFMDKSKSRVAEIISERKKMFTKINTELDQTLIKAFNSEGNFLLIRVFNDYVFENLMKELAENGIRVLNTSSFVLLENTFRVSIGNKIENKAFLSCLKNYIGRFS